MEPRRVTGMKRPRVPSRRPRPDQNQRAVDVSPLSPTARLLTLYRVSTLEPPECGHMAIISSAHRNPKGFAYTIAHDDELIHAECHRFCRLSSGQYSPEIRWELLPRREHSTNHRGCQAASCGGGRSALRPNQRRCAPTSDAAPQPATLRPNQRRCAPTSDAAPLPAPSHPVR
jgi:hypothetical protein